MEQKPGSNDSGGGDRQSDYKKRTNNYRGNKNNGNRSKNSNSNSSVKFVGLNKDELEGIVICESMPTPTAQQFDALYEALIVYGGSRNSKVKTSLRKMKYITKDEFHPPKPDQAKYKDEDGNTDTVLQSAYMEIWKKECEDSNKAYRKYREAIENLFETIKGQLGLEIKNNLKSFDDWEQIDEDNDTIGLIKNLKELCYRDNNNRVEEGVDVIGKLMRVILTKQHEKTAAVYVEELTNKWDVFRSIGGTISSPQFLKQVLKSHPIKGKHYTYSEYHKLHASGDSDEAAIAKKIDDIAGQRLLARMIIGGSSDKLHQGLRLELMKDFAKGYDNYPNSSSASLDLLNQYKAKNTHQQNKNQQRSNNSNNNSNRSDDKKDAKSADSKGNNKNEKSFTNVADETPGVTNQQAHQLLMKGEDEDYDSEDDFLFLHFAIEHDREQKEHDPESNGQFANHIMEFNNGEIARAEQLCESNEKRRSVTPVADSMEYANMSSAFLFAQRHDGILDPMWLLLDSQATCNIICNPALVKNIRKHPTGNKVTIYCNAGSVIVDTVGDLNGFGMVWFHKDGIANCLSLALVSDRFRITLDTAVAQGFFVHRNDGSTRRFDRADCNLYVCDLRNTQASLLVTTVKGQKEFYSDLDVRRAKAARKLQEVLGYPSTKAFLRMIDNNMIKNCAVTRRDVKISDDIYGVNANIVKGKSVRRQPPHVREDILPVPPDILERYGDITLAIDVYHINGIRFFRSISRHLMFRTTQAIADAKAGTLFKQVKRVVSRYALRGFKVVQIYGDNEFNCIKDRLMEDLHVTFHSVARGAHEPYIERDNRVSKERCRCIYSGLPFNKMPPRMIMELPVAVDFWLNYWCSSGGVSQRTPPRQLITGIALDASKHCKFQYGDYVLASNETDITMKPRANDAIFLRPTGTPDGAFFVFDLKTARRVRKHSGTLAHMTDTVIKRVHEIADSQQAPAGLTFGDIDNNVTILDIDTESIATEDDDDDASDASFTPDDTSIDTELTGVIDDRDENESVRSGRGYSGDEEDQSTSESIEGNYVGQISDNITVIPEGDGGNVEVDENQIDEAALQIENENNDENENINDDEIPDDTTVVFEEEGMETPGVDIVHPTMDEEPMEPQQRVLRETVRRTHPKYSASEGFEETTIHRNLFCGGYEKAIRKIADYHARIVLVSQAIEQYNNIEASLVTPQYGVKRGLEIFGEKGAEAVLKELKQLHDLSVVSPVHPRDMTKEEIKRALPYLMFLKRKRCGKIKGRGCADGRSQRDFISREEASSPTASIYAIMLTCVIDAIEGRYVATTDIPGAFLQTDMPEDETVHIRISGAMAELMAKIDPDLYNQYIISRKRGTKVLFAKANKAIYGTLRAALLFWQKLKGKLAEWGFEENPYDACTMNKIIDGEQATIVWHVDDLKISHKSEQCVRSILSDLESEFGKVSPLTTTLGKVHDYLGMTIDYSVDKKVRFTMFDYLHEIIENLPEHLIATRNTTSPAADHLFTVNEDAERLNTADAEIFHSYTAKLLFAAKRARPDIQTAIAFLCTRVKSPDVDDWKKLKRVLGYIKETIFLPLTLGSDGTGNIYWYVDASFAVHNNMRSHTGAVITFGIGAALSMSTKQKINTKSSTEAEIVGVDDSLPFNIWCLYFLREQGYRSKKSLINNEDEPFQFLGHKNILYQDNTSSIRLESNGKASSTKRTRHINIRYFLVTDRLKQGEISTIEYCPTEEMIADYFTKPLQGAQFRRFRNAIMGITDSEYLTCKLAYESAKAQRGDSIGDGATTQPHDVINEGIT